MTSEEERAKGWAMGEGVRERVALDLVRYTPERLASREIRGGVMPLAAMAMQCN